MAGWLALDPLLVWGLLPRGLGLVFLISFVSLSFQVLPFAGAQGAMPIARTLACIRRDFPSWRRCYYFPTLLWLCASDRMLRALTYVGFGAALGVVIGGPWSRVALLLCYLCYLSLDLAMALIFPWDCLLFECTLLALLLPATHGLPELGAVAAPVPALCWAYRLLLFRLLLGFGKQKFLGSRAKDLAYLKGFLVNQPLPSKLGWYAQKLPLPLLEAAVLFMFVVEVPAAFLALAPGPLSLVCAALTVLLMLGIQLLGTFGYFSLATIVLCIPLLDNVTPGQLELGALFAPGPGQLVNAYVAVHTLGASVALLFNSWLGQTWHLWAFWYQLPRWLQPCCDFLRFLHPFRWLHPYGVFPPNTSPGVRMTLLFEVSWDGAHWHELEFRFSPCHAKAAPRFIAPHHPRGDQALIYDTFGLNATSLMNGFVGNWSPYPFASRAPLHFFCQALLRGQRQNFLCGEVLAQHAQPPAWVRVTTHMLEPVSAREHARSGDWWRRSYVGPHLPAERYDPEFWSDALGEPELWHFEAICWRRRSRLGTLMERARAADADVLALAAGDGLSALDVARFWHEFVPLLAGDTRESFATLPDVRRELNRRFGRAEQRALQRVLGRFALLLVARLEPLYLYRGRRPLIAAPTYFHLWLLAHHIIGAGQAAYLAAFAEPASVASYLPALTPQTGLYPHAAFRLEELTFEAQKLRLIDAFVHPHDAESKRANAARLRSMDFQTLPAVERFLLRVLFRVSGFFHVLAAIRDGFQGPRFDQGFPERYPRFHELDSGVVVLATHAHGAPAPESSGALDPL